MGKEDQQRDEVEYVGPKRATLDETARCIWDTAQSKLTALHVIRWRFLRGEALPLLERLT
jgi:hypothetical protein